MALEKEARRGNRFWHEEGEKDEKT